MRNLPFRFNFLCLNPSSLLGKESGDAETNTDSPRSFAEDQRSIANRLANETGKDDESGDSKETREYKQDPTLPVSASPCAASERVVRGRKWD